MESGSLPEKVLWKRTCESLGEFIAQDGFPPRYGMRGLVGGNWSGTACNSVFGAYCSEDAFLFYSIGGFALSNKNTPLRMMKKEENGHEKGKEGH
ncbi:hypothetical protein ASU35_14290 [Acetivibrio ethanolgignens]|uniref:Uncharacterized protein n=1 Tax=Acetivibrio ethanolgignens TaxID=290052 RepID=A0A0V8QCD4_9FIRM|nr:hypothetical protein ASU35_14290 [Acetivibrio ethanolgignens]